MILISAIKDTNHSVRSK